MAPVPGLSEAAVNEGSSEVSEVFGTSLHEPQSLQTTMPSPGCRETTQVGQQTPESLPTKSLFGPFPTSTATNHDGQRGFTSIGSGDMSASTPAITADPIEYPEENRQKGTESSPSPPNIDPLVREPLKKDYANISPTPDANSQPPLTRVKTVPAIGPATDKPTPVPKESEIEGPVLFITLLLSSTGARHPYKLDEKYLRKRNVSVEGNNPINISLYKLKELILRDWREGNYRPLSLMMMCSATNSSADTGVQSGRPSHPAPSLYA